MRRRILITLLLASSGMAADVLVMRDGTEIVCQVVSQDARQVVIEVDGHRVTFDAVGVAAVRRNVRVVTREPQPSQPVRRVRPLVATPSMWSLAVGLGAGWLSGNVDGDGTLLDRGTGVTSPLSSTFELDGFGALPGIWSRIVWEPHAPDPSLLLGVQAGYGGTGGGEADYVQTTLAVVGGWSWPLHNCRLAVLADAGLARAALDRTLALPAGEQVDTSADLSGWTIGLTMNASWPIGRGMDLSADLGVHHARLTGDTTWDSSTYHGAEDLSAALTSMQAGLGLAWRW